MQQHSTWGRMAYILTASMFPNDVAILFMIKSPL